MTLWVLCEHGKQNAHAVRETFCGDESCPVHGRMSSQGCPGGREATIEDYVEWLRAQGVDGVIRIEYLGPKGEPFYIRPTGGVR